jgi:hypothetical protein
MGAPQAAGLATGAATVGVGVWWRRSPHNVRGAPTAPPHSLAFPNVLACSVDTEPRRRNATQHDNNASGPAGRQQLLVPHCWEAALGRHVLHPPTTHTPTPTPKVPHPQTNAVRTHAHCARPTLRSRRWKQRGAGSTERPRSPRAGSLATCTTSLDCGIAISPCLLVERERNGAPPGPSFRGPPPSLAVGWAGKGMRACPTTLTLCVCVYPAMPLVMLCRSPCHLRPARVSAAGCVCVCCGDEGERR